MRHYTSILNGISQYIESEIAARLNGSLKAWGVRVVAGVLRERAGKVLTGLINHPLATALELVDGEQVDEELLFRLLLDAARQGTATVEIPMIGSVTFNERDVESLHRYITGA